MILLKDIVSAIPLGFFLSFMIGPVFFVLLETSVVKGFRAAITFDLGVVLADVVFILIAYFSSYRLIQSIKDDPALFIFGGLVMLTYGIISFIKNRNELRKNIVLSRKELLEESMKEKRDDLLSKIKVGDILTGRVKNITDFGVFIDAFETGL